MPDPFIEQAINLIEKAQAALNQMAQHPPESPPPRYTGGSSFTPPRYNVQEKKPQKAPAYQPSFVRQTATGRLSVPGRGVAAVMAAVGGAYGLLSAMFLTEAVISFFVGELSSARSVISVMGCMTVFGFGFFMAGFLQYRRLSRLRRYSAEIGSAKLYDLTKLAEQLQLPVRQVRRDLVWLIRKTPGAYMDTQRTCLILEEETYQQYLELKKRQQLSNQSAQSSTQPASQPSAAQVDSGEADEIVREGRESIRRIHEANDALPGEEISQKLSQMEAITAEIFRHVGEHPSQQPEVRRMVRYHLPATLKLVDTFRQLEARPVQGENIAAIQQEILTSLDMVNSAFERLLNDLYADIAIDVSSDISVLSAMLAQEGLTGGRDFHLGGNKHG